MSDPADQFAARPRRSAPKARSAALRGAVMLLLMAGPLLLAIGCNEQKHYRMLSFFFDGVPLPEHMRQDLGLVPQDAADSQNTDTEETVMVFYHRPYQTRECFGCHDNNSSFEAISSDSRTCQSCHESYFQIQPGDWVHGPVAMGMCGHCHQPHKSEHPGLLPVAQPDICYQCHEEKLVKEDVFHSRLEDMTCSRCHDPHAAGNRRLLADSRTFRRMIRHPQASAHQVWERETCSKCHDLDQSNVLLPNVDQVCMECHEKVVDTSAGHQLHQAVTERKCTTCHTPHESTRPHLIHDTAEQICFTCHKIEEVQTPQHPPIVRGDCLSCHTGHHAQRPKLLRPGILGPEPLIPPAPPEIPQAPQVPKTADPANPSPSSNDSPTPAPPAAPGDVSPPPAADEAPATGDAGGAP